MNEKKYMKIIDEYNNENNYEILCAYKLLNTNKNYVIYTDNTYTDDNLNIYASIYYPNDDTKLEEIETEEEWMEVQKRIEEIKDKDIKNE